MVKLDHVASDHQQCLLRSGREQRWLGKRDLQHPEEEIVTGPLQGQICQQPPNSVNNLGGLSDSFELEGNKL